MKRLALFGGTFDPVHKGHIEPLLEIADTFHWDQIRLIPTCIPPHRKQPEASNLARIEMLQQLAKRDPRLVVDSWEIEQGKPSRTWPTLQYFSSAFPDAQLYFVLGMDSYVALDQWLNWTRLSELAHLVVLPRPGYNAEQASAEVSAWQQLSANKARVHFPHPEQVACSATELRDALYRRDRQKARDLGLFDETFHYIETHNLYRELPR